MLCSADSHLEAGEAVSVFVFTSPHWSASDAHFPMHTMLFSHYMPRAAVGGGEGAVEHVREVVYAQPTEGGGSWDLTSGAATELVTLPPPSFV